MLPAILNLTATASDPAVKLPVKKMQYPISVMKPGTVYEALILLTYGGDECCVEGVVREAKQNTGLPHTRVSDKEKLEKQVVRLLRHRKIAYAPSQ